MKIQLLKLDVKEGKPSLKSVFLHDVDSLCTLISISDI